jgi:hypothetical protein
MRPTRLCGPPLDGPSGGRVREQCHLTRIGPSGTETQAVSCCTDAGRRVSTGTRAGHASGLSKSPDVP